MERTAPKSDTLEAGTADGCGMPAQDVPNPYAPGFLTHLYDKAGLKDNGIKLDVDTVFATWEKSGARRESSMNCKARRALHRLMQDGLIANSLGMDFSVVQATIVQFSRAGHVAPGTRTAGSTVRTPPEPEGHQEPPESHWDHLKAHHNHQMFTGSHY